MDRVVYLALNSLKAIKVDQRINANNLANIQVPGFKKDMPMARSSTFLSAMDQYQSRVFVSSNDKMRFSDVEGYIERTEGKMDFAIRGEGYFFVEPALGLGPALSRRGDFNLRSNGDLVDGAGNFLLDNNLQRINLPAARRVIIDEAGKIIIEPFGSPDGTRRNAGILGTILGSDLDLVKDADGAIRPTSGAMPQPDQQAIVLQGSLEKSNADSLDALLRNIEGQRTFELNVKFIKNAEELDKAGTRIMGFPS
ncbi:MAG: flagellar hook-basal body complex protein [Paracoccaceae bacterium]|nr:flagellar hook-basal body complex protein [Paracoccaceae bacterium]